jgi:hypothetical protein
MMAESEQKTPYIVERRYCIKILLYDVAFLNVLQLVKGQSAHPVSSNQIDSILNSMQS